MRASLGLVGISLALVGGCHAADPCAGFNGTCVALTVDGATSSQVDRLVLTTTGLLDASASSTVSPSKTLPVAIALHLPADVGGSLPIHAEGLLGNVVVGDGDTTATVTPGKHTTAELRLTSIGGQPDLSMGEDLTPGPNDDLSVLPPDLTPPPDLTGTICTPNAVVMCADAMTLELCSSDGFSHVTRNCPNGCGGSADLSHCKLPMLTAPLTGSDFAPPGTTATTLPATTTIYLNTDTGLIATTGSGATTLRTANGNPDTLETNHDIGFRRTTAMGIFSFGDLTLPNGSSLWLTGSRMAAITSNGTMQIIGVVEGRAFDPVANSFCGAGIQAAGGGFGGTFNTVTGTPGSGTGTGGGGGSPGAGKTGGPGGGGGSHGGQGGQGGNAHYSGGSLAGGSGGSVYGSEVGMVHAGSGGASGANGTGGTALGHGAGGSGGAGVQIVAAVQIIIGGGAGFGGVNVGGCGGYGNTAVGSTGGGGGGGGSGGMALIEAPTVQFLGGSSFVAANGGGGGGGGATTASGGGGNGGSLNGSVAGGGSGATGCGADCTACAGGGAGSAAATITGIDGSIEGSTSAVAGAGGGGGGAGFSRVNSAPALSTFPSSPTFGTASGTGHVLSSAGTLVVN